MEEIKKVSYIEDIKEILRNSKNKIYNSVNSIMLESYWKIGKRIIEEEQNGNERAEYGKEIIKKLSKELTNEFGKGFSDRNLLEIRRLYNTFPEYEKLEKISKKLTWSHIQRILRIKNEKAREYYLQEASENMWTVRALDRNISTLYYERIISSVDKETVEIEMKEKTKNIKAENIFKDPMILEFLNLSTSMAYTENELEKALIDEIQKFMLELGKGFAFVKRQELIKTETSNFYIDLVFYNYILKCFVLIELKVGKLTHQDIGQLDMYVRMYDDLKKREDDNNTIGLLLCTDLDNTIVKYSILNEKTNLFASKYINYLPTEEELIEEIERKKLMIEEEIIKYKIEEKK